MNNVKFYAFKFGEKLGYFILTISIIALSAHAVLAFGYYGYKYCDWFITNYLPW